MPQFKVNVKHGGVYTDYINDVFSQNQVKRRENNYDVATLWFADAESRYYEDAFSKFDEIKIYFKDASESTFPSTPQFGGNIRQVIPTMNQSGFLPSLLCKGYGAAWEETHCNRDYGLESANPEYPRAGDIWTNIVEDFVEKSFAGVDTGYGPFGKYITDSYDTVIKYINNPYRTNLEVVDLVCELTSAIGAGLEPPVAGAHWVVDAAKRFLVGRIGNHGAGEDDLLDYWPDWWNPDPGEDEETSRALSTLEQGVDFTDYVLPDKSEEFANKVVLITDFRRPSYDFWSEYRGSGSDSGSYLWEPVDCTITDKASPVIVGLKSLSFLPPGGTTTGYGYYPKVPNPNGSWNLAKFGSVKTIPRLNFYYYKEPSFVENASYVRLFSTTYNDKYYQCKFSIFDPWGGQTDKWIHCSIPVGPYWKSDETAKQFIWDDNGTGPNWAIINGICFVVYGSNEEGVGNLYIDDLHFTGKIIRSAKNSTSIDTLKMEFQKVHISRNAMDDSCVAGDDSGFAGRIAYAELLRRLALPKTIIFTTTRDMKAAMAGQKLHIHAEKKANGTFRIDGYDWRILELQEDLVFPNGMSYTVTATTDLLNSTPISVPDQYAMWQENMFLNSKEAKNIRSGAEVDLLIPMLEKNYGV